MLKEAQKGAESVGAETEYIFPLIPPGMAGRKTAAGIYSPPLFQTGIMVFFRNISGWKTGQSCSCLINDCMVMSAGTALRV